MPWHFIIYRTNPHPDRTKAKQAGDKHGGRLEGFYGSADGSEAAALYEDGDGHAIANELGAKKKFVDIDES
jgi:hypothetical protein